MNKMRPLNPRKEGGRISRFNAQENHMTKFKAFAAVAVTAAVLMFPFCQPARAIVPLGIKADPIYTQPLNASSPDVFQATATFSTAGYNQLLAWSGSLSYVVLAYNISCYNAATTAVSFCQSDNKPLDVVSSTKTLAALTGSVNVDYNPFGIVKSSAGASLGLNLSNTGPCGIDLIYTTK